jgi:hypothetical protein
MSTSFIYYNWINPEAGRLLEEAEKKAAEEKAAAAIAASAPAKPAADGTNKVETVEKKTPAKGGESADTQAALLEKNKDAPIVKEITEKAEPDEIPAQPDGLGISIEETSR